MMETKFKDVWRIEASAVAMCCGIITLSGCIDGFNVWILPALAVPLLLYALSIWMFGHGSSLEMGVGAVIFAVLMAILFPVLQKADVNRRYKQQKAALNQKRHPAPLLKNAPKPAAKPAAR